MEQDGSQWFQTFLMTVFVISLLKNMDKKFEKNPLHGFFSSTGPCEIWYMNVPESRGALLLHIYSLMRASQQQQAKLTRLKARQAEGKAVLVYFICILS